MSVPTLLAIVLNMQAALQGISRAGGYHYDVKADSVLTRPTNLQTVAIPDVPVMVLGHDLQAVQPRGFGRSRSGTLGAISDRWRITIVARVDAISDDAEGCITAFADLASDLEVSLTRDLQRGGLASYTYVMQPIPHFGLMAQSQVYLEQPVEVLLDRPYGQP